MDQAPKPLKDVGTKSLIRLAELIARKEHGGVYGIFYDNGRYHVAFGSKARRVWPADDEGHGQLRPALLEALSELSLDDLL